MNTQFLPAILLALALVGCATGRTLDYNQAFPCDQFETSLGPSHHCPITEGGALDEFEIRREITSRVLIEGQALPHKEYGKRALIFYQDGRYQARKLYFTQYWMTKDDKRHYLVYAEDSIGRFEVLKDGTIELKAPDESTCADRESSGSETIAVHLRYQPREEPYRTVQERVTFVAFETKGWLKDFHGYDSWQGRAQPRAEVQWPPYPADKNKASQFRFAGFMADIHYGCLNKGFAEFRGNQQIYLVEHYKFDEAVNPWQLKPGTRLREGSLNLDQ